MFVAPHTFHSHFQDIWGSGLRTDTRNSSLHASKHLPNIQLISALNLKTISNHCPLISKGPSFAVATCSWTILNQRMLWQLRVGQLTLRMRTCGNLILLTLDTGVHPQLAFLWLWADMELWNLPSAMAIMQLLTLLKFYWIPFRRQRRAVRSQRKRFL